MKQFLFSAEITPTDRHTDFWVNDEKLKNLNICAENLKDAMNKFFDLCESAYYPISKHSKTHPSKMYVHLEDGSCKKIGYVFTGKTSVNFNNCLKDRYVSLWTTINELKEVFN